MTNESAVKFSNDFTGKPLETVEFVAKSRNIRYRFSSIDGNEGLPSRDCNNARVNLTVVKGIVTKITIG